MNKEKIVSFFKKFYFSFVWLTILLFGLDLLSKWIIQNNVVEGQKITVINDFFWITKAYNKGAAFSALSSGEIWQRILWMSVSVVMSAGLIYYYVKNNKKMNVWYKVSLSMMIAGALGNMIDRLFYWKAIVGFDGVIDWLSFKLFGSWYFPAFNIADSALVVGVIILLILLIVELIQDSIAKGKKGGYKLPPKEYEKKLQDEVSPITKEENNNENKHEKI